MNKKIRHWESGEHIIKQKVRKIKKGKYKGKYKHTEIVSYPKRKKKKY